MHLGISGSAVKASSDILALSNGARSGLTDIVAGLARPIAVADASLNNLLRGPFDTDHLRADFAFVRHNNGDAQAIAENKRRSIAAGRFGHPDKSGAACAFLCSVQAGYITGQNLLVDSGACPGTF